MTIRTTPAARKMLMLFSDLNINQVAVYYEVEKQVQAQAHVIAEQLDLSISQVSDILIELEDKNKIESFQHQSFGKVWQTVRG